MKLWRKIYDSFITRMYDCRKNNSGTVFTRKCSSFLDASNEVLLRHKGNDHTRSRNSFEHHLKYLLPLKRKWFIGKENVDVLNVDHLNADEVGRKVKKWVDFCIGHY